MDLSLAIIIPTFNSARTLAACLDSIRAQSVEVGEVVVVDDVRTTDATRAIAHARSARIIVSPAGMAESRNIGVEATGSPILLSLDSDMVLKEDLLACIIAMFRNESVGCASLAERSVGQGYWARARSIDKESVEATGYGRSLRVFRRELFSALGGYDPTLEAGEDADFHARALRAGWHVCHIAKPGILHDEGRLKLWSVALKKYRYGATLWAFEAKHDVKLISSGYGKRILTGARIALRQDPLAAPGFLILKTTDLLAGQAGRRLAKHPRPV